MILNAEPISRAPEVVELRHPDEIECMMEGHTGQQALDFCIKSSLHSYEVSLGGEPIAYWGYKPPSLLGPNCWAWMLTTRAADRYPLVVGLGSRRVLDSLLSLYPSVHVAVDPDHLVAVRWLEWLGFTPLGPLGRFTHMAVRRH